MWESSFWRRIWIWSSLVGLGRRIKNFDLGWLTDEYVELCELGVY